MARGIELTQLCPQNLWQHNNFIPMKNIII